MTLRYCGLLSLFLGKFNSVNGHLRYHLCPETAQLARSPSSSAPPVYIALVTPPSLPPFALRTYVLQEEGN